jgi:hypothetical protein
VEAREEAWKHGRKRGSTGGSVEAWKHGRKRGSTEAWKHGSAEARKHGSAGAWKRGRMEAWKHGSTEAREHGSTGARKHGRCGGPRRPSLSLEQQQAGGLGNPRLPFPCGIVCFAEEAAREARTCAVRAELALGGCEFLRSPKLGGVVCRRCLMMSEAAAATLPGARGRLARDSRQRGVGHFFFFFLFSFLFGEDQEALLFGDYVC